MGNERSSQQLCACCDIAVDVCNGRTKNKHIPSFSYFSIKNDEFAVAITSRMLTFTSAFAFALLSLFLSSLFLYEHHCFITIPPKGFLFSECFRCRVPFLLTCVAPIATHSFRSFFLFDLLLLLLFHYRPSFAFGFSREVAVYNYLYNHHHRSSLRNIQKSVSAHSTP